ncbi:MAG: NAD-dependent epimerase/dehydratase family protein [Bacteroidia bacterium]
MTKQKILILGGTQFIGRTLVEQLLEDARYEVTLFNRQKTAAALFPQCKAIKGDRLTDDIRQIGREDWDYVIDCSCYFPAGLQAVLDNLTSKPTQYIFISTCSVYESSNPKTLKTEDATVLECTAEQATDPGPSTYGNRKIACEHILQASGISYTILRPALVFGPYDHTDRLYYWLFQVQNKSTLLMPDNGERQFSITYVKDLVAIILESLTKADSGVFNVISKSQTSIGDIVANAEKLLNRSPNHQSISPALLSENNIAQWTDMPLWIDGDHFTYENSKLLQSFDIELTPFEKAIAQTIEYYNVRGWDEPVYGMAEDRRLELLGN